MKILDSNILIYSQLTEFAYLRPLVFDEENAVSKISQLEVLGFHRLDEKAKCYFESCFQMLGIIDISGAIIDRATALRQRRKMSLGDAIVAATALHQNATLLTRNVTDFADITDLNIVNPIHD
jgi:hypothetical protein